MAPGPRAGHPPTGGPLHEALLEEVRLVGVLDGVGLLADALGQGGEPDRAPGEASAQHVENRPVDFVETQLVDAERLEPGHRCRRVDTPVGSHLHVVPHPPQQPVGDARGPAGTFGDAGRPLGVDGHAQDAGRPGDDGLELVDLIVIETPDEAEPVAQGSGDQPGPGGGPHQSEPGKVEPDAPRRGPLADEDVQLEVLHGRIEDLLHRPVEPVDLVDEQDVALLQIGEQGGKITRPYENRAGRYP